uniref:Plastidial lipoyltransferase 2-like n=1 Tax=Rhizophora mucronata TaxID=61149 RepID=A0A2P2KXA3_RHIMU
MIGNLSSTFGSINLKRRILDIKIQELNRTSRTHRVHRLMLQNNQSI